MYNSCATLKCELFFISDIDENNADFHVSIAYRPGESGVHLI